MNDLDIIERHIYGSTERDVIGHLISFNQELADQYRKMILIGEFCMDHTKNDKLCDPSGTGVALHNSIWASALSGSFSSALNWWWAGYVRANNLYPHYRALRNFVENIPWNAKNFAFINTGPIRIRLPENQELQYRDIEIGTRDYWGEKAYREFIIDNNGEILGGAVNAYLHGTSKKDLKINPAFHVRYPTDGKFKLSVGMVSQGGRLVVFVDGKEVLRKDFPAGPGNEGPWKRSLYRKDHDIYQCIYDTEVAIDIPEGAHIIRLTNTGKDWIGIKKITLTNYSSNAFAHARVTGLVFDKEAFLWIQNKDFNWRSAETKSTFPIIDNAWFTVNDVENGIYVVEWWDTFKGGATLSQEVLAEDSTLTISIPPFRKDRACKIRKR